LIQGSRGSVRQRDTHAAEIVKPMSNGLIVSFTSGAGIFVFEMSLSKSARFNVRESIQAE
jgi:hypothetical protein